MIVTATLLVGLVLAGGGLVGLAVGYIARHRRDHPAAEPLSMMAVLPGLGGLCLAGAVVVPQPPFSVVLLAGSTGLTAVTPAYFLLFALVYTGHEGLVTHRRRRALVGIYVAVGAVVMLEPLLLSGVTVRTVNGLTLPVMEAQMLLTLSALVSYPPILISLALLGRFLVSSRNIYRGQTAIILVAVLFTVAGNVAFEGGLSPHPGLNLTSVFFAVEVTLIALALFRYDFLSVEPLAPDIVLGEMDDPVIVLDETTQLVDTNPAASRLLGGETPAGTPIDQLLPGLLSAAEAGEEYVPGEGVQTDGGTGEVYDLNDTTIRDQYDRDQGTVVVLRDISLQKQRERTLASLQSVSQQFLGATTAEEVFEIAVDAVDELLDYSYSGAMVYDADDDCLRPMAFAESLAAAYDDTHRDTEPVVEPGDNDIWRVFESGEPMLGAPMKMAGEAELPVEIGGSLLYPLGDHGILGISAGPDHEGFSDDDRQFGDTLATTTENALDRVEKERQLRESRELLETRSEQLQFFNSALRHDLLNGLMVVQGHIDRLDGEVEGEAADRVATIDDWTTDLATMAREVRSVTKTVAGVDERELEPVDLESVLTEKAAKFRQGHEALSITVETGSLPPVRADSLLASVVENILQNAVDHNDSEAPAIAVSASSDAGTVTLRIADNGPGIGDGMKEAIFEEAVTSERSGSVGFGLYFVRVMVDRYGGDVWFEDRPDGQSGAVAVMELPTADAAR